MIPTKQHLGGYMPFVFTEHSVLMLANVLRSKKAIEMSIRIIELFVKLREMLLTHSDILLKLEQLEKQTLQNSDGIKMLFSAVKELIKPVPEERNRIGFLRADEVG